MKSTTQAAFNTMTTNNKASTTATKSSSSTLLMKSTLVEDDDHTTNDNNKSNKSARKQDNNNNNDEDDDKNKNLTKLLEEYKNHKSIEYHYFSSKEAIEIRAALLKWYRENRRKLPWRGDPPPYTGSTAGINLSSKKSKTKKGTTAQQSNITSFFNTTTNNNNNSKRRTSKRAKKDKDQQQLQEGMDNDDSNNTKTDDYCDQQTTTTTETSSSSSTTTTEEAEAIIPITGYGIWVSEIMLQQTRVEAVIPYWIKWMKSFPTLEDLANATPEQVNSHWAGLGFYRRAKLLHDGAKKVILDYNGILPTTNTELLKLPGIGPYTANAISSIAFNQCVPVVDGNVCRVLCRLKGISNHIKSPILKDKLGWVLAKQLVEATNTNRIDADNHNQSHYAGEVNQALMELGATYCSPSGTGVDNRDPLKDYYMSTKLGRAYHESITGSTSDNRNNHYDDDDDDEDKNIESKNTATCYCELCRSPQGGGGENGIEFVLQTFREQITTNITKDEAAIIGHTTFPLDPPKGKKREEDIVVAVISNTVVKEMGSSRSSNEGIDDNTRWLLVKRPPNGLLAGQWEFPSVCVGVRGEGDDNSEKKKNKNNKQASTSRTPGIQKRRTAMDTYLKELFDEDLDNMLPAITTSSSGTKKNNRMNVDSAPLEHIFSHIKHYMWIETCETELDLKVMEWTATTTTDSAETSGRGRGKNKKKKNNNTTKREVRWMRETDMKEVGITSGVQKILKAVKQKKKGRSTKSPYFSKKRKR